MRNSYDMILTTASNLEGYKILKQLGVVYGETVLKASFLSSVGAALSNFKDSFSLSQREMSGTMSLINDAREFAYKKMISDAKNRGANAIIAIDSDNTIGGEYYVPLSLWNGGLCSN